MSYDYGDTTELFLENLECHGGLVGCYARVSRGTGTPIRRHSRRKPLSRDGTLQGSRRCVGNEIARPVAGGRTRPWAGDYVNRCSTGAGCGWRV